MNAKTGAAVEHQEFLEPELLAAHECIDDLLVAMVERKAHLLVKPLVEHGEIADREIARRVLTDFGTLARKEYATSLVALVRLMIAESVRSPDLRERVYQAGPASVALELRKLLSEVDEAGVLTIPDSHLAADKLLSMLREPLRRALLSDAAIPSTFDEMEPVATSVDTILDTCAKAENSEQKSE
jgi:hypothetical protein